MRPAASLVLLCASAVVLAGCRDKGIDPRRTSEATTTLEVPFAPETFFYVQDLERVDSYDGLVATLPFEPVLPTYLPDGMKLVSAIAQPVRPATMEQPDEGSGYFIAAAVGATGSLSLEESPATAQTRPRPGREVAIGNTTGMLAQLGTPQRSVLFWSACDLEFSLRDTGNAPDFTPVTEEELVRVAESIIEVCE